MKRYGKCGKKVSWNVKWYGKYGRTLWKDLENTEENCEMMGKIWKVSWIVKRFGKYRRKLWKHRKNMDEMWNDMENMEEK